MYYCSVFENDISTRIGRPPAKLSAQRSRFLVVVVRSDPIQLKILHDDVSCPSSNKLGISYMNICRYTLVTNVSGHMNIGPV
jgi:hypothetical protein